MSPSLFHRGGVHSAPLNSCLLLACVHLMTTRPHDRLAQPDGRRECLKQSKIVIQIDRELQAISCLQVRSQAIMHTCIHHSYPAIPYQLWTPNHARHTTTYLTAIVVTQ